MFKKLIVIFMMSVMALVAADDLQRIQDDLRQRIDTITGFLGDKSLAQADKNQKIIALSDPILDFSLMSQLSLEKNIRAKLTPEQLQEFTRLFEKELKNSFLTKLESYSNEKIEFTKNVQTQANRISVFSVLKGKKEDMEIIFKYYLTSSNSWKIYDLEIAGVSLMQTYRTQFAEIVNKDGVNALLDKLRQKQ